MSKRKINVLKFYYALAGRRLIYLAGVILFATFLEGFGLTFALPILQGMDADNKVSRLLRRLFAAIGCEYTLLNVLLALVVVMTCRSVMLIIQRVYTAHIRSDILSSLRTRVANDLFSLDYLSYLKQSAGRLNNTIVRECNEVVSAFGKMSRLMVQVLFVAVYLLIPILLKPALVAVIMMINLPMIPFFGYLVVKAKRLSVSETKQTGNMVRILVQTLGAYKYLKATAEDHSVRRQIAHQSRVLGRLRFKQMVVASVAQFGFEPFVILVVSGIIYYYVGMKGQSMIEVAFVLVMLVRAIQSMIGLQNNTRKLMTSWGSIRIVDALQHDLESGREPSCRNQQAAEADCAQPIRFEHVDFDFGDAPVLQNVSLEIPANAMVAFVGGSGAGKSTLVNLAIGLIDPVRGRLLLGDVPYAEINRQTLRKKVGYITQENVIFNDTILNNVSLWDDRPRDQVLVEVKAACRKALIADFVEAQADQYEVMLGESGINISGGQRQRICIARELYKESSLLVFDEATSALDTQTEQEIQKNIDDIKGEKTIILIAHRLSTVRHSDRIFVLKDGRIAEQGSYTELYERSGEFRRMVDQQQMGVEDRG